MMKKIIHIYGASGSGTSTLGKTLAESMKCTFMDTDDYFWEPTNPPFQIKRSTEDRIALMQRDIDKADTVVLSGALAVWGDVFIPQFILAVRLVTPTDVRIQRIKAREYSRFGDRILENGDMYTQHQAFLRWASAYDTGDIHMRSKAEHDWWQTTLTCKHMTLNGSLSVEQLVSAVLDGI